MNAIQFIQQHGVEKAREAITDHPRYANFVWIYNERITYGVSGFNGATNLIDLKRLVDSLDLVNDHGGLETIKKCVEKTIFPLSDRIIRMKQAIADYESIFGGEHV
ncbi:hypothetical protein [Acinetobacter junii]|uniref:hypothetical protein n=1 Tax=Acinetobacter junii TaxID=40215 RepID=UPI0019025EE3|nr:hypothetical protein [Acinetobacter junii]MBJ8440052.1 hypothetical protein [Acinetobacter junii]